MYVSDINKNQFHNTSQSLFC